MPDNRTYVSIIKPGKHSKIILKNDRPYAIYKNAGEKDAMVMCLLSNRRICWKMINAGSNSNTLKPKGFSSVEAIAFCISKGWGYKVVN